MLPMLPTPPQDSGWSAPATPIEVVVGRSEDHLPVVSTFTQDETTSAVVE